MKIFKTEKLQISPELKSFFSRYSKVFQDYPNLWVKGGAARDALLSMTSEQRGGFIREPEPPRDLDLVLIEDSSWQSFSDSEDKKRHLLSMFRGDVAEEDFEIVPSLEYYMSGRDISVNQVLINPKDMIVSDYALRDATRGHISPTNFEYREEFGGVGQKVALRSLLFSVRDNLKPRDSILKSLSNISPFWILIFLFKAADIGVGDRFFDELKKYNSDMSALNSFEEALLWSYSNVTDFALTEKQQKYIDDAKILLESEMEDYEAPFFEKIKVKQPFVEARLNNLIKALLKIGSKKEARYIFKLAAVSDDDNKYMKAISLLAKEIMAFITPTIEYYDTQFSRSRKVTDEEDLRMRLGLVGYDINRNTPAGVTVSYVGEDDAPTEINVTFGFDVFSDEVKSVLINKKGLRRNFFVVLTLNDVSEASGGGASIEVSLRDILEGGTNHSVQREFWPALEVFMEQMYHEIAHLDRSGTGTGEGGAEGTIRYLANPGEMMTHSNQVAIILWKQNKDLQTITEEDLVNARYPRKGSKDKVMNYINLSSPDRIQKYQSLVPDIDLSTIKPRFLELVNGWYQKIKETH